MVMKIIQTKTGVTGQIEVSEQDWRKLRNVLVDADFAAIIAISWGGPFEREGTIRFRTEEDATMFYMKYS
jgi:hypothetical protein